MNTTQLNHIRAMIITKAKALGFQQVGITDVDLSEAHEKLQNWLAKAFHGEMAYMQRHGSKRTHPDELVPGTLRVISCRMNYLTPDTKFAKVLKNPFLAFISRYALGKDYHKLIRKRLKALMQAVEAEIAETQYRVFCDSAPVMEKPLAQKAGLGWIGKSTNLINTKAGSWFFLGTIYTNLPLPVDTPATAHCGSCQACLDICPTKAIVAPFQLDARRCISYLTIELKGAIPETLRPLMGNRIYGCDDCQIICPWNKFSTPTTEPAFLSRQNLDDATLLDLFAWTEPEFYRRLEGFPIRRIGFERWQRNIAVALGNCPDSQAVVAALKHKLTYTDSALVREHIQWAILQHSQTSQGS